MQSMTKKGDDLNCVRVYCSTQAGRNREQLRCTNTYTSWHTGKNTLVQLVQGQIGQICKVRLHITCYISCDGRDVQQLSYQMRLKPHILVHMNPIEFIPWTIIHPQTFSFNSIRWNTPKFWLGLTGRMMRGSWGPLSGSETRKGRVTIIVRQLISLEGIASSKSNARTNENKSAFILHISAMLVS